jgi:hypothetical protein
MTRFDRGRQAGLNESHERTGIQGPPEPPILTTPRRAAWSAASVVAIVTVLFMAFYGINTQRTREGGTGTAGVTAARPTTDQPTVSAPQHSPSPVETTGQQ